MAGKPCLSGCDCGRHTVTAERRANLSAAARGKPLTDAQRPCVPDCTCAKHMLHNSGQFQPGLVGAFTGRRHTDDTKAKIRAARSRQINVKGGRSVGYRGTPNERFDSYVIHEPNTGCHLWTGAATTIGYGAFGPVSGLVVRAHRFAYERAKGPIPDGLEIDHLCATPSCVNSDHLETVTHAENLRRANVRRRQRRRA